MQRTALRAAADRRVVNYNMPTLHPITPDLIAPRGMNCGLCLGYLREKNHSIGCMGDGTGKVNHYDTCMIKNCEKLPQVGFGV